MHFCKVPISGRAFDVMMKLSGLSKAIDYIVRVSICAILRFHIKSKSSDKGIVFNVVILRYSSKIYYQCLVYFYYCPGRKSIAKFISNFSGIRIFIFVLEFVIPG
jgi:hypothetical protein